MAVIPGLWGPEILESLNSTAEETGAKWEWEHRFSGQSDKEVPSVNFMSTM